MLRSLTDSFCLLALGVIALLSVCGCSKSRTDGDDVVLLKLEISLLPYTDEQGYVHSPLWQKNDVVIMNDTNSGLEVSARPAMSGTAVSIFLFPMDKTATPGMMTFSFDSGEARYRGSIQYSSKALSSGLKLSLENKDAPQGEILFREGDYIPGISLSLFGNTVTSADLAAVRNAGCMWVEVVLNPFWRNVTPEQGWQRAQELKSLLDASGLKVWSCHLPFSSELDISHANASKRYNSVQTQQKMMQWAEFFGAGRVVLHPSSEPIADTDRQQRLINARESIGLLRTAAADCGVVLCVENLPRTCLGRESSELQFLIGDYPDVMVCFDSNHLLTEEHSHFFATLGPRIATIHASDYDRVDERHWLEGMGCIDWPAFRDGLLSCGYKGVFMHEVRQGDNVNPASIMNAYKTIVCK